IRDAGQPFLADTPLQLAAFDHVAAQIIEPVTLPVLCKFQQCAHLRPSVTGIVLDRSGSSLFPEAIAGCETGSGKIAHYRVYLSKRQKDKRPATGADDPPTRQPSEVGMFL